MFRGGGDQSQRRRGERGRGRGQQDWHSVNPPPDDDEGLAMIAQLLDYGTTT